MHSAVNLAREDAYVQMQEKHAFYIRYLVRNRKAAEKKLKKMDNQIKRDASGKVAKKSMEDFNRMEVFRNELNTERLRLKSKDGNYVK